VTDAILDSKIPRLMLAATGSGTGKTTLMCALLTAWVRRKLSVMSFKCGPDYIDPMFHSRIIGVPSRNLDVFMSGEAGVRFLLARSAKGMDLALIEGVMGLYDGVSDQADNASSNHLALITETPTVLVVNVRGMARSTLAMIQGFQRYAANTIQGVILNHCPAGRYEQYKLSIESELGLRVYGYFPPLPQAHLGSRHLGLITAAEIADLTERLEVLGDAAERCIDLDGLLELSKRAPILTATDLWPAVRMGYPKVRIGVARDQAFCFLYQDNLDSLARLGAELVDFSPLSDQALPEDLSGLILPGGYPELHAVALSGNTKMRASVRTAVEKGIPLLAECGGFMYLMESMIDQDDMEHPMVGVIKGQSKMTGKLSHFGYHELRANRDTPLCAQGEIIRTHEFHYSSCSHEGTAFTAHKRGRTWTCVHAGEAQLAGYPHYHFAAQPHQAERFINQCRTFAEGKFSGFSSHQLTQEHDLSGKEAGRL